MVREVWVLAALSLTGCFSRVVVPPVGPEAPKGAAEISVPEYPPVVVKDPAVQEPWIPEGLEGTYIGMPYQAFTYLRLIDDMEREEAADFRLSLVEKGVGPHRATVTYYFDRDVAAMPLYEYIVEFPAGYDVDGECSRRYGPPNAGTEWLLDSGSGFNIRVWIYGQKIVLAGEIKGTEWVNE